MCKESKYDIDKIANKLAYICWFIEQQFPPRASMSVYYKPTAIEDYKKQFEKRNKK